MALEASAAVDIEASPREVLEFVLDLKRYRQVDGKIRWVGSVVGPDDDGHGTANVWGKLRWTPPTPDRYDLKLRRWDSLVFTGARRHPSRLILDFTGTFICEPTSSGTRLTHSYRFEFKGPFKVLERPHRQWLQHELEVEVAAIGEHLPGPVTT